MFSIRNNSCIKPWKYWYHPERISKLRPFIDNYDWTEIEFPAHSKDWRKFECNNKTIALNVLCVPYNDRQKEVNDEENKENEENKKKLKKWIWWY